MNIEEYQKMVNNQSPFGTQSQFSNLAFPLIKKIVPQLLGGEKKMKEIEAETKSINRENKIKSIEEDIEFKETKIQDHPDYESACGSGLVSVQPMPGPSAPIFHLDFDYGSSSRIDDFFISP